MFKFADYKLRPATEADRAHCEAWIESDPDHRGKVNADFFVGKLDARGEVEEDDGIERWVLEDKNGESLFYFRMLRALRIDIQFGPTEKASDREKNREALRHGFEWLIQQAQESAIRQVIFQSEVSKLASFCEKRFGFQKSPGELVCSIASPKPLSEQEKAAQPLQRVSQHQCQKP